MSIYNPVLNNQIKAHNKKDIFFTGVVTVIVIIFSVFSLVYLSHANMVATKGYQIKKLQEEKSQLQTEIDTWNLKLTRLQSLKSLQESEKILSMKPLNEVPKFISKDNQVALAK